MSPLPHSTTAGLVVDNLGGGYGDTIVLRNISLSLAPGQVLGVLGRNGVGKSTLMRLLTGFLPLSQGTVHWQGEPIGNRRPNHNRALGIAYAPQEGLVFDALTVRENLSLQRPDWRSLEPLLTSFGRVRERMAIKAGVLSGGEKKLVSFVRSLGEGAALTLLDEPTEGVQHENIALMAQHIRQRSDAGASFLIVEQNLSFLMSVMQRVLVLDHGEPVFQSNRFTRQALEHYLRV